MQAAGLKDIDELLGDIESLNSIVASQRAMIARLEHNVEVFRRLAFGASSEKRRPANPDPVDANQGHLFFAELVEEAELSAKRNGTRGTIEQIASAKPAKKSGGRRKTFPSHLPVVRTTYELAEDDRSCVCGNELHEIGEDVRKELERVEITIVHEIACKKYGCRACSSGVRTAPGPDRVIDKGLLGKGFLAHVMTDRFLNHLPYYRLEKKYASEGLDLNRSVLQRSMARCAELLEPIWKQIGKEVAASGVIFTDDTPVTIAQGQSGKSREGRIWIYLDLDKRHFYDVTDSRKRDGPARILGDFKGFIHADAYPGYDRLFLPGGATEVACWAHARRKFVDAEKSDPTLAKEAIDRIRELYAIEKAAKDLDGNDRAALRMEHAKPLLDELGAWMELSRALVLPKGAMGQALNYALNQWDALNVYVTDGRLQIDNNAAERALRAVAVGRKNWLFFMNEGGGKDAAILMSVLQTANAIGINARSYIRDVLSRIAHCSDVRKLTPHGWKEHFADEVDERRSLALKLITSI